LIEIPASFGPPYMVSRTQTGLVRLARATPTGREVFLLLDTKAALAVADAMVDAVEVDNN
jgi:hypothetical protein